MRVAKAVMAGIIVLAAVSGCSGPAVDRTVRVDDNRLDERTIILSDGREITCVVYKAGRAGGLSCDWMEGKK